MIFGVLAACLVYFAITVYVWIIFNRIGRNLGDIAANLEGIESNLNDIAAKLESLRRILTSIPTAKEQS